ncbi:protein-disulfide reductase DsbD [Microbulbifer sp. THAF38]|uniref:protein-disulfide reductase DsbD family protein n=1 Tax=Microbulbifer sp. THAF38 TaxID=2587856 RepID=UPI0012697281|nr:thioredoxin family protein [Microbulbifer sp. THAF38]QFT53886.1 Thiol:disulfide interchange protein DsbD precursor [Microbulbifer sp. THAF38]
MLKIKSVLIIVIGILAFGCGSCIYAQEQASGEHVRIRWLAPSIFEEKVSEKIGFYFEVDLGWHVYWQNSGDSGAPPRFDIDAEGASLGKIEWPFPTRLRVEHLTNLGYKGNVAYLFDLKPKPGAQEVSLKADLEWLVCKIECIPGRGTMTLSRPVEKQSKWALEDLEVRNQFAERVPLPQESSPWRLDSLALQGKDRIRLLVEARTQGRAPQVFPLNGKVFSPAKPIMERDGDTFVYIFKRQTDVEIPAAASFVLSDGHRAWEFDEVAFSSPLPAAKWRPLWLIILAAFAGGVILNLMPCVFPVLSIKLFGLIGGGYSSGSRLREGLLYSAGVVLTFTALGLLLLVLRAGGSSIGWGFQLQSPSVVLALIVLFWVMAMSFHGVFEFGHHLVRVAGLSQGGTFATGVLAVFVAAPCTGPFMGVALGTATVLPPLEAMLIFVCMGIGLAAPFLILCISPALMNRLPSPGPWMDKLRQLLAFPLYATVIWLLWVFGRMEGETGWLLGTSMVLLVTFALLMIRNYSGIVRVISWGVLIISLPVGFMLLGKEEQKSLPITMGWKKYDPQLLKQAQQEKRSVFVDYTAAWCVTCQVNKKRVLDKEKTLKVFQENGVLLLRADWTREDPVITESLAALGRNSIPVYAWYPAGAKRPQILPQILQEYMIIDLFDESEGSKKDLNKEGKPSSSR